MLRIRSRTHVSTIDAIYGSYSDTVLTKLQNKAICHLSYARNEMNRRFTKLKSFIRVRSRVASRYQSETQFENQRSHFAINGVNKEQAAF